MSTRLVLRGVALLGGLALIAELAVTALAQPAQPRVVQSSDGSLYLVQGGNAWSLVPDPIDDEELAALNLGGEVDGNLPATLLNVAAPAPPRVVEVPVPAPPAVLEAPAPAPAQPSIVVTPLPAPGPPAVAPPGRGKGSAYGPTATPTPPAIPPK